MNERAIAARTRRAAGLEIHVAVDGRHLVVALRGEVDTANADGLPAVVLAAIRGDESVRIDLSEVTFLDSALLRSLLICQARLAMQGTDVKVRNPTPQGRRIFELTSLTSLLEDRAVLPCA